MNSFEALKSEILLKPQGALGVLTAPRLGLALQIANAMCQITGVRFVGTLSCPGQISLVIAGEVGAVRAALMDGQKMAGDAHEEASIATIVRPETQLVNWLEAVLGGGVPGRGAV